MRTPGRSRSVRGSIRATCGRSTRAVSDASLSGSCSGDKLASWARSNSPAASASSHSLFAWNCLADSLAPASVASIAIEAVLSSSRSPSSAADVKRTPAASSLPEAVIRPGRVAPSFSIKPAMASPVAARRMPDRRCHRRLYARKFSDRRGCADDARAGRIRASHGSRGASGSPSVRSSSWCSPAALASVVASAPWNWNLKWPGVGASDDGAERAGAGDGPARFGGGGREREDAAAGGAPGAVGRRARGEIESVDAPLLAGDRVAAADLAVDHFDRRERRRRRNPRRATAFRPRPPPRGARSASSMLLVASRVST